MVFLGASLALALRTILFALLYGVGWEGWLLAGGVVLSPVMLLLLAGKAYKDFVEAEDRANGICREVQENHERACGQVEATEDGQPSIWDKLAEERSAHMYKQGGLPNAFLVPFVCTLAVSLSDPLRGAQIFDFHS